MSEIQGSQVLEFIMFYIMNVSIIIIEIVLVVIKFNKLFNWKYTINQINNIDMDNIISSMMMRPYSYYSSQDIQMFRQVRNPKTTAKSQIATPDTEQISNKLYQTEDRTDYHTNHELVSPSQGQETKANQIKKNYSSIQADHKTIDVSQFDPHMIVELPEQYYGETKKAIHNQEFNQILSKVEDQIKTLGSLIDYPSKIQGVDLSGKRNNNKTETAANKCMLQQLKLSIKAKNEQNGKLVSKRTFRLEQFRGKLNYQMLAKIKIRTHL